MAEWAPPTSSFCVVVGRHREPHTDRLFSTHEERFRGGSRPGYVSVYRCVLEQSRVVKRASDRLYIPGGGRDPRPGSRPFWGAITGRKRSKKTMSRDDGKRAQRGSPLRGTVDRWIASP